MSTSHVTSDQRVHRLQRTAPLPLVTQLLYLLASFPFFGVLSHFNRLCKIVYLAVGNQTMNHRASHRMGHRRVIGGGTGGSFPPFRLLRAMHGRVMHGLSSQIARRAD